MIEKTVFKVSMTDYSAYVDPEEAVSIQAQMAQEQPILTFTDLFGSFTVLPFKDFHGMWETSPAIREEANVWEEEMAKEAAQSNNKTWE
jgi:hypothetical protein